MTRSVRQLLACYGAAEAAALPFGIIYGFLRVAGYKQDWIVAVLFGAAFAVGLMGWRWAERKIQ